MIEEMNALGYNGILINGSFTRFAKGYYQTYRVNYMEQPPGIVGFVAQVVW